MILFIFFMNWNLIFGQETVWVVHYYTNSNQVREEFEVLKEDNSIKHGKYIEYHKMPEAYVEYNKDAFIKKRGWFHQNYPVDLWEYFSLTVSNYNLKIREEFYDQTKFMNSDL